MSATRKQIRQTLADEALAACASLGVLQALPYYKRVIQDAELPLITVALGAADYDPEQYGGGEFLEVREYRILAHVAAGLLGTDGASEQDCEPFLDALQSYFVAHREVDVLDDDDEAIDSITVIATGDGGIVEFDYGTQDKPRPIVGVALTLRVEHERSIDVLD